MISARGSGPILRRILLIYLQDFLFLPNHWLSCIALPIRRHLNADKVVVVYHNNDVCGQAIFIRVIVYLGDVTIYVWSSSSHCWLFESTSSTTTSKTTPYNRCCRWAKIGYTHCGPSATSLVTPRCLNSCNLTLIVNVIRSLDQVGWIQSNFIKIQSPGLNSIFDLNYVDLWSKCSYKSCAEYPNLSPGIFFWTYVLNRNPFRKKKN
jgi:hypothetical protein